MLCMLGAALRGSEGDRMVREGRWDSWSPAFMVGRQVSGKHFGVAGMGRVGQVAAERAHGFGMEVDTSIDVNFEMIQERVCDLKQPW